MAWKQRGKILLKPVINAVLVVDMEELVFNPGDLFRGLPPSFSLQWILSVDWCQAHHGLLTHTPLMTDDGTKEMWRISQITTLWIRSTAKTDLTYKLRKRLRNPSLPVTHSHDTEIYFPLTLLSNVLSFTKLSKASLTKDKSFLAAVTIETMTSWRMASSGSCDLTLKNSGKNTVRSWMKLSQIHMKHSLQSCLPHAWNAVRVQETWHQIYDTFYEGINVNTLKPFSWCTSEVFGQVWVVHETVTCKLYTLQSDWNMDVIKPMAGEILLIPGNKMHLFIYRSHISNCYWGCYDTHLPR